jgi:predicted transcriptional regulator
MRITVDISPALETQLAEVAARLNVNTEDLAAAAVRDLVSVRDTEFEAVARRVLEKNRELYRRLA